MRARAGGRPGHLDPARQQRRSWYRRLADGSIGEKGWAGGALARRCILRSSLRDYRAVIAGSEAAQRSQEAPGGRSTCAAAVSCRGQNATHMPALALLRVDGRCAVKTPCSLFEGVGAARSARCSLLARAGRHWRACRCAQPPRARLTRVLSHRCACSRRIAKRAATDRVQTRVNVHTRDHARACAGKQLGRSFWRLVDSQRAPQRVGSSRAAARQCARNSGAAREP